MGSGTHALAQDDAAAPAGEPDTEEKEKHFGLYVEAAGGLQTADDLATGIRTLSTHTAESYISLEDMQYVRAAVGWQLQHGKGDFRLRFDGWKEDGYKFVSNGRQASLDPSLDLTTTPVLANLDWWSLTIEDGRLEGSRTPPQWDPVLDDANFNEAVDPEEARYDVTDLIVDKAVAKDLQNRAQTIDLLYGRTFGRPRYSARWWAGMRYFKYEGNLTASAWLLSTPNGAGFTEDSLLPLINFRNESSGLGPTGAMEADFNFFDQRLQLYLYGQVAFMYLDISTDSGLFTTLAEVQGETYFLPAEAQLTDQRDKSTWQNAGEVGARWRFRSGLQIELAYNMTGLLDVILLPNQIRIPANSTEAPQGTSALYKTQDIVLSGWRAGFSFQF
jgi:hypothetical protein